MAEVIETTKFDLQTLDGIGRAREILFNDLMNKSAQPEVVREAERMLRGQQLLKGDMRIKFLALIMGNKKFEPFAQELALGITAFVNGAPAKLTG